ncbi:UNVERIFIED_CONTAM: Expansin-B18 [Sesamum radiatum]|uniref:Expansin-B18 n=1 Tax=Sesamum radiatum TaxID=300843 RepID=A0AAW2VH78_SESRA
MIISDILKPIYVIILLFLISFLPNYCYFCIRGGEQNHSRVDTTSPIFSSAVATWYGDPNGAGSDGGACGYRLDVEKPPFSAMISAGNANLFKSGLGCGACYQAKCTQNVACSGKLVTVTITDEYNCDSGNVHFDLSGKAFGALARPGQAETLRAAGTFPVHYRRVACDYPDTALAFEVDSGSNPYYFACVVKYVKGEGEGELSSVELQTANSKEGEWRPMQHYWGATWKIDLAAGAKAPFSIRLVTRQSKKVIVAKDVIPAHWLPGKSYKSLV